MEAGARPKAFWLNRPPDLFYGCIWFVRSMESVSIILDVCSVVHSRCLSLEGVDEASANRDLIAENQFPLKNRKYSEKGTWVEGQIYVQGQAASLHRLLT